jgi:DMSO/TMAO reductase YedYZ molybdopterin-dependent catalytic subunit
VDGISREELALAARNHGMPLEALRYPVTPLGLHYLLTHYDIPAVDPSEWTLTISGLVERPAELTLDEIRALPSVETIATMECAGNGRALLDPRPFSQPWLHEAVGTAHWRGTPLRPILDAAGISHSTVEIVFTSLDRGIEAGVEQSYARSLTLEDALRDDVLLAWEINGVPLPPQHGFPLRLLVPGWYGMTNVKWLASIEAVAEPFTGHQQRVSYRLRQDPDEPGVPLTRILPRALMLPPGTPDFPSGVRTLRAGRCTLEGRAWSGWGEIASVEVSTDAGRTWSEAALEPDVDSPSAWVRWNIHWDAPAGEHELRCRATDAAGNQQPDDPQWNLGGYANNAVQRLRLTVTA